MSGVWRRGAVMPPPFPPATDDPTEPGLGAAALKVEIARLLQENGRLRRERDAARAPTWRKILTLGSAVGVGVGVGIYVLAKLLVRAAFERWPHLAETLLGALGGR